VVVKSDFTLRRFNTADDVEANAPSKLPRSYLIRDIEFISADISPRFSIRMKSRSMDGGEGETMKLSADTEAERVAWMRVLHKMKESAPQAEEDDDPYRECSARAAGAGWAGQAGGPRAGAAGWSGTACAREHCTGWPAAGCVCA
jgi:hypothetical protein